MFPSKGKRISKSKIYKAIVYLENERQGSLFFEKKIENIKNYNEIEYLTILFALGIIEKNEDMISFLGY